MVAGVTLYSACPLLSRENKKLLRELQGAARVHADPCHLLRIFYNIPIQRSDQLFGLARRCFRRYRNLRCACVIWAAHVS